MNTIRSKLSTNTYIVCQDNSSTICADITEQLQLWNIKIDLVLDKETNKYTDIPTTLPTYFLTLKAHKILMNRSHTQDTAVSARRSIS